MSRTGECSPPNSLDEAGSVTFRVLYLSPNCSYECCHPNECCLLEEQERSGRAKVSCNSRPDARRCGRRLRMIRVFSLNRAVITSTVDRSLLLKPVSRDWNRYYVIINEPQWCVDVRTDAIRTVFSLQATEHDSSSSLLDWTQEISL